MAAAIKRLVPLFDRIVVQKAELIMKTDSGIVLPEKGLDPVLRGTVLAVGPGERNEEGMHIPPTVRVGDEVLLPEYGGTRVQLDGQEDLYLYKESHILAKFEEN